jgi:hypothetical protein
MHSAKAERDWFVRNTTISLLQRDFTRGAGIAVQSLMKSLVRGLRSILSRHGIYYGDSRQCVVCDLHRASCQLRHSAAGLTQDWPGILRAVAELAVSAYSSWWIAMCIAAEYLPAFVTQ